MDAEKFVSDFVSLATKHNEYLLTKEYAKRSRINKKLMKMLGELSSFESPEAIVSAILHRGNKYSAMWITNYAFSNDICVETVKRELQAIEKDGNRQDACTAWLLLDSHRREVT